MHPVPLFYSFIYLQVADVDFCINGTEFKFYVKPYFLRWAGDTFYIKLEFRRNAVFWEHKKTRVHGEKVSPSRDN